MQGLCGLLSRKVGVVIKQYNSMSLSAQGTKELSEVGAFKMADAFDVSNIMHADGCR